MSLVGVSTVKNNIDKMAQSTLNNLIDSFGRTITWAEAEAKAKAPWTDRTGNARQSITGSGPAESGNVYSWALCIGMFYGVYLELSNGGKYRIVWPTIEGSRPMLSSNIKNALSL
jgi:Tfp pilus tip-associated adhesin PilY1